MNTSLTIGNFDGVHLGHQELIRHVLEIARSDGSRATLMTFEPHPREFLGIRPVPARLCSPDEKMRRIRSLGLANVVTQTYWQSVPVTVRLPVPTASGSSRIAASSPDVDAPV